VARSNRLLAVGGVVTVVGAGLVLAVLTVGRGPSEPTADAGTAPPPAATVEANGAVTEPVAESGAVPVVLDLPDGLEAVALTVDFEGSVAGLPSVGDRVHVYGVPAPSALRSEDAPATRIARLLDDVEVLAITGADHATNGGNPTVVLGIDGDQVPAALTAHGTQSVHLTLVDLAAAGSADGDDDEAADAQAAGR
jgi:Flp pilus assembly protein CpaB